MPEHKAPRGSRWIAAWCGLLLLTIGAPSLFGEDRLPPAATLDVRTDPEGGVRAHATLQFGATMPVVERVLTDFANWPQLFETKMRMARVDRLEDRVITELFITHPILPGESRLLSENRLQPGHTLTTTLLGGDFKRYARTWRLSEQGAGQTRAEFDLLMEAKTLAPDWLVAITLRKELETHFRRLTAKIAEEATGR